MLVSRCSTITYTEIGRDYLLVLTTECRCRFKWVTKLPVGTLTLKGRRVDNCGRGDNNNVRTRFQFCLFVHLNKIEQYRRLIAIAIILYNIV